MSKVKHHLIDRLALAFNEPEWPDEVFMRNQWEEVFKSYSDEQLEEAADIYIRGKLKTFPMIGHIREILGSQTTKPAKKVKILDKIPEALLDDYSAYADWHDSMVGRFMEKSPYGLVMPFDKDRIIDKTVGEFCKQRKDIVSEYDLSNWRTAYALAWKHEWLPTQVETAFKRLEDEADKDVKVYIKKVMTQPEKQRSVYGRILLDCMPDEVRKEDMNEND